MMNRVAVFIDYQNVYRRARDAFELRNSPHWEGQIHPFGIGYELAKGTSASVDRELSEVRIYRGLPDARRDPKGNAACVRQLAFWASLPKVVPVKRPIQYAPEGSNRSPREKGIDVQLAVDLVMGAVTKAYDLAVVFSADTDLCPALDAVAKLLGPNAIEVATWRPNNGYARRIKSKYGKTWCHYLDETAYRRVADEHDYNSPRPVGRA